MPYTGSPIFPYLVSEVIYQRANCAYTNRLFIYCFNFIGGMCKIYFNKHFIGSDLFERYDNKRHIGLIALPFTIGFITTEHYQK